MVHRDTHAAHVIWVGSGWAHHIPCDLLSPQKKNSTSVLAPAGRVFYGAVKLDSLLWIQQNSMSHYCFFHLKLIKHFSVAKLVCISTHACMRTHTRADALVCILKMLIFICENEGAWQWTLKLITNCLQQLLNSDKCLKQTDYISRPQPSWDRARKFS